MGAQHSTAASKPKTGITLIDRIKCGEAHHVELENAKGKCLTASNLKFLSDAGTNKLNQYHIQHHENSIFLRDHHEKILQALANGTVVSTVWEESPQADMLFEVIENPQTKRTAFKTKFGSYLASGDKDKKDKLVLTEQPYEFKVHEYIN